MFCSVRTCLAAYRFKTAFFQCLVDDEVNGNVSDSIAMVINRRADVSIGIARDGSCSLPGSGMTFAILTMQEVEMRISLKEQLRLASKCDGRTRGRCKGLVRQARSSSSQYAAADRDDRGVVVRRRLNAKREALMGTGTIESGGYMYPNMSIRRPVDPLSIQEFDFVVY